MNIIFANRDEANELQGKYVVLELDTLRIRGSSNSHIAWCVIELEHLNIGEIPVIEQYRNLHNNLMKNYHSKNWKYCEDAIEHLKGRWKGTLDTFYDEILQRISSLKEKNLDDHWDGIIVKE